MVSPYVEMLTYPVCVQVEGAVVHHTANSAGIERDPPLILDHHAQPNQLAYAKQ